MPSPVIALTMGDPGGIGPEVIAKCFKSFRPSRSFYYLLIGTQPPFDLLKQKLGLSFPRHLVSNTGDLKLRHDRVNFLDISSRAKQIFKKREMGFKIGAVSIQNAAAAWAALEAASQGAAKGLVKAFVTAPVNKTSMRLVNSGFSGHTEYLAKKAGSKKFAMMFVGSRLKVTLVTIHVPLRKVSGLITQEKVFEKIDLTNSFLKTRFKIKKPRIAVCALNPHGKETGTEENEKILPAVQRAKRKGIDASGPLSADQIFFDAYEGRFDAVISMYHDQGLAPFKMIAFRDGVNVTLGLPYIRTSPDHGTAFDIAYQGKADPSSMKSALDLAVKLAF